MKQQKFQTVLRSSDKYIPELALVAEDNGQLIGHIMLSKFNIIGRDCKYETLLLAPIYVML